MPDKPKVAESKRKMRGFAQGIVSAVFDGELSHDADFALGFAAAIDAMSRVGFKLEDPAGVVMLAARDVYRPPPWPRRGSPP